MKIVMTGGGTAGHVTPNIALVPALKNAGFDIEYIGTRNGMEKQLIENEGISYNEISAGKLRRYLSFENLTDVLKIGKGFIEANSHIRKIKPDIVFSKGGFVSCPVVWAAWVNRVPVIVHESDMTPGLANKLSLPFAKKICYAFPETRNYVNINKGVLTGIPIRDTILNGNKISGLKTTNLTNEKPIIVVIGGSLGSKAINTLIRNNIHQLLEKYQIVHICGKDAIDNTMFHLKGYVQYEYVKEELKDILAMSDIVISRAGATTLYEILTLEKPNILIPLPKAVSRGDQILNANFFKNEGYSEVLQENDMSSDLFLNTIEKVLSNKNQYINKMNSSKIKNSADIILDIISKEIKRK